MIPKNTISFKMKIINKYFECFFYSIMITLLLSVSGCSKNEVSYVIDKDELSTSQNSGLKAPQELDMLYKLYCPSLMDYMWYCAPPAWNCLKEVIIRPGVEKSSTDLSLLYERFLEYLSHEKINDFFKDPESGYTELFPYLLQDEAEYFLTYLQNEQYDVYQKYNAKDGINLFIIAPIGLLNEDNLLEYAVVTLQVKVIDEKL